MSVLPHDLVYKYSYKNRLHLSLLKQKILIASDDFYLEFLEKKKKLSLLYLALISITSGINISTPNFVCIFYDNCTSLHVALCFFNHVSL